MYDQSHETHMVDVDFAATEVNAMPDSAELERYGLRMLALPEPLCNGQRLIRLYGTHEDLCRWLHEMYEDDGLYVSRIKLRRYPVVTTKEQ